MYSKYLIGNPAWRSRTRRSTPSPTMTNCPGSAAFVAASSRKEASKYDKNNTSKRTKKNLAIHFCQLDMAMCCWYLVKSTCPVYACILAYTDKSLCTRYHKNTAMFIWSALTCPQSSYFIFSSFFRIQCRRSVNIISARAARWGTTRSPSAAPSAVHRPTGCSTRPRTW